MTVDREKSWLVYNRKTNGGLLVAVYCVIQCDIQL